MQTTQPLTLADAVFPRFETDSRAMALAISRSQNRDVEIGISDNGFYIASDKNINVMHAFKLLKHKEFRKVLDLAIDKTEVLKRRFRHCAMRALMILRNYKGHTKRVGRQQVSSMILMNALKRIDDNFTILKEAKRECLQDLMDVENTKNVLKEIENNNLKIVEIETNIPTPFAFNLALQGYMDVLKIEDKHEFLRRMHIMVLAKIGLKPENKLETKDFSYQEVWAKSQKEKEQEKQSENYKLKEMAWNLDHVPVFAKRELIKLIDGEKDIRKDFIEGVEKYKNEIKKNWPKELKKFLFEKLEEFD